MLEELKARGLLFVDDGSVKDSAGYQVAGAIGLDYSVANVQIDPHLAISTSTWRNSRRRRRSGAPLSVW